MGNFKFDRMQRFTISVNGLPMMLTRAQIGQGANFTDLTIGDAMLAAVKALEHMHDDGATGLTGEWNGLKITIEIINGGE